MLPGVLPRKVWDSPREFQSRRILSWLLVLHSTHSSLSFRNYKCIKQLVEYISTRKNHKTLEAIYHPFHHIKDQRIREISSADQIESNLRKSNLPWAEQCRQPNLNAAQASPHPPAAAKHEQTSMNKTSPPISPYGDQNNKNRNYNH